MDILWDALPIISLGITVLLFAAFRNLWRLFE